MTTLVERVAFKRTRLKPTAAYQAGDAKIFDSECGQYRIQRVRRAYGVAMTPHFHALRWNGTRWELVATSKTFAAAARSLGVTVREEASTDAPRHARRATLRKAN